ncbi:hypothetical protein L3Y34_009924 [Caenorhabditis briggsae]|uniref:Uncharacterized protein n=1 Tax=Caenorhabditis briggsae TaxID=6238 RepID=A0AAE9D2I1_CAEBR|nr:hypothetical protein L3Y34_009924 [Caenorhabditis briggsae]
MKIFGKKCISEKDNSWPYTSGWIRVRRQKNLKKELKRFEIFEENSEENSEFLENLEPQKPKNQKFYNLEEHFVENRRKRRILNAELQLGFYLIGGSINVALEKYSPIRGQSTTMDKITIY